MRYQAWDSNGNLPHLAEGCVNENRTVRQIHSAEVRVYVGLCMCVSQQP